MLIKAFIVLFISVATIGFVAKDSLNLSQKQLASPAPSPISSEPPPEDISTPAPSLSSKSTKPKSVTSTKTTTQIIEDIEVTTDVSGETTVEINQDVLNNKLKTALAGRSLGETPLGEATISDVQVAINRGYIEITGTAKAGFISPSLKTSATIDVVNAKPKIQLSSFTLNGLPLPQIVTDQIEGVIQAQVDELMNSYDFTIKTIRLEPQKIIIVGVK
jgi:hypothetical protein